MTLGIFGLAIAYVLIGVLLLNTLIYTRWAWYLKTILIIITSLFYITTYLSLPPLLGWPTEQELPANFRLIAAQVVQPNKDSGASGAIYLWVTKLDTIDGANKPRSHQVAYSNELHEKIVNVNAKLEKDIPQLGEYKERNDDLEQTDEQRRGVKSVHIQFYDMPDPLFPDK